MGGGVRRRAAGTWTVCANSPAAPQAIHPSDTPARLLLYHEVLLLADKGWLATGQYHSHLDSGRAESERAGPLQAQAHG